MKVKQGKQCQNEAYLYSFPVHLTKDRHQVKLSAQPQQWASGVQVSPEMALYPGWTSAELRGQILLKFLMFNKFCIQQLSGWRWDDQHYALTWSANPQSGEI